MIIQEIDETNCDEIYEKERDRVEKKFAAVRSFGQFDSPSRETLEKWGKLMRDPTCWAYAYLKDPEGQPLKLYPFQDRLVNEKDLRIMGVAANQIGKTIALAIMALHHACYVNNAFVLLVSRSEEQAIRILDVIKNFMRFGKLDFSAIKDAVDSRSELHLKSAGGKGISVIKSIPPTASALGYPATFIGADEMGFWDLKERDPITYFYQVLETRTNTTKNWKHPFLTIGQIVCISNPNGKQGLLWHLWDKDKRFSCYRFAWVAKPTNLIEDYKAIKEASPSDVFDSSYAAVFSSSAGSFITEEEYQNAVKFYDLKIPGNVQLFLGCDFAGEDTHSRGVDLTALTGVIRVPQEKGQHKIKLVFYHVFEKRVKKRKVYEMIEQLAQKNVVTFAYDKVGVGDGVKEDLRMRGVLSEKQIIPLSYSLPNKSEVYWNLKDLFSFQRLIIRDIPQMKDELLGLRFEKTQSGYIQDGQFRSNIKVHHQQEKKHDDIADAFANACFAAMREGVADFIPKWIPIKKLTPNLDIPFKNKKYNQRVMCGKCQRDWDYHQETTCICGNTEILDYCTEKPLKS